MLPGIKGRIEEEEEGGRRGSMSLRRGPGVMLFSSHFTDSHRYNFPYLTFHKHCTRISPCPCFVSSSFFSLDPGK